MANPSRKSNDLNSGSPVLFWIPAWAVELWIFGILLTFLVIRVLGSGTGHRLISYLQSRLHG